MAKTENDDALRYHSEGRPGKIEVIPTKPHSTQRDLALAYSPGVAKPCLEIEKDPKNAYKYTAKGNLVAVISNGTAVLGLGDIGTLAGKPVMEGKGLLFKIFADVDVFDIEVESKDIDKFVQTVKDIAPTFGGINLEDISAPACFEIEERLKAELDIPIMHDDQHGTAIISAAGLINALELAGKKIEDIRMVVNGAGASAMACTNLVVSLGAKKENVLMLDSKGVLTTRRDDLNKYKQKYAVDTPYNTLEEAIKGADVFFGLSVKDMLSKDMVKSMADNPVVFAMANPDPEITYEDATDARKDVIMATGRSDYPNQVNNVLGFPFIFRGALDVKATGINEEMKKAAVYALANLAKQDVPESVMKAYNVKTLSFGREYIIPKPLDPRLITTVAPAVAKAAMDSGLAQEPITDWDAYKQELKARMGLGNKLITSIHHKAKTDKKKVAFAEADHYSVLKAAHICRQDDLLEPILIGDKERINQLIQEHELELDGVEIIDPFDNSQKARIEKFAAKFHQMRQRKGMLLEEANDKMHNRNYFAMMMVETGQADAVVTGYSTRYREAVRPALEVIGTDPQFGHIAGMYILNTKKGPYFLADTTVNFEPDAETIVQTTLLTADTIRKFNIEPRIAMLSFSNFGSVREAGASLMTEAVKILHEKHPNLMVDGEMQANYAINADLRMKKFPFSKLENKRVNTLIFPNLAAGNIAYKLLQEIGNADAVGPILMGANRPVHIVQMDSSIREIVNIAAIAAVDAQG